LTPYEKLRLAYAKLLGEYTGVLQGFLWYDLPTEVRTKIEKKIEELKATDLEQLFEEE
jgi:hypothetical protein